MLHNLLLFLVKLQITFLSERFPPMQARNDVVSHLWNGNFNYWELRKVRKPYSLHTRRCGVLKTLTSIQSSSGKNLPAHRWQTPRPPWPPLKAKDIHRNQQTFRVLKLFPGGIKGKKKEGGVRLGNRICERHFLASSEKTHTRKICCL